MESRTSRVSRRVSVEKARALCGFEGFPFFRGWERTDILSSGTSGIMKEKRLQKLLF